jgi:hypothetical protein
MTNPPAPDSAVLAMLGDKALDIDAVGNLYANLMTLYYTGMQRRELAPLRGEDIDSKRIRDTFHHDMLLEIPRSQLGIGGRSRYAAQVGPGVSSGNIRTDAGVLQSA